MTGGRITYVGHATALIELAGARLLTDPVLRPRLLQVIHRHPAEPSPQVTEGIDAVLISHLHHDHLDFPSLRRLPRSTTMIVPTGAARTLRRRGFAQTVELATGDSTAAGGVEVTATTAVHEGRRFKLGPMVEAAGYLIRGGGASIYFAGDTDLFDEMEDLAGSVDVALLPIAGWGPKVGRGHLDPRRAAEAAARIRPRVVVPIHWGTLLRRDLHSDSRRWLVEPPERFAAQLGELAPEVELSVLEPGESLDLPARSD